MHFQNVKLTDDAVLIQYTGEFTFLQLNGLLELPEYYLHSPLEISLD